MYFFYSNQSAFLKSYALSFGHSDPDLSNVSDVKTSKIRRRFWIRNPPLENIYPHCPPCSSYSLYDKNLPLLLHGGNYCPKASLLFDFPLWCSSVASSRSKLSKDNFGIWTFEAFMICSHFPENFLKVDSQWSLH